MEVLGGGDAEKTLSQALQCRNLSKRSLFGADDGEVAGEEDGFFKGALGGDGQGLGCGASQGPWRGRSRGRRADPIDGGGAWFCRGASQGPGGGCRPILGRGACASAGRSPRGAAGLWRCPSILVLRKLGRSSARLLPLPTCRSRGKRQAQSSQDAWRSTRGLGKFQAPSSQAVDWEGANKQALGGGEKSIENAAATELWTRLLVGDEHQESHPGSSGDIEDSAAGGEGKILLVMAPFVGVEHVKSHACPSGESNISDPDINIAMNEYVLKLGEDFSKESAPYKGGASDALWEVSSRGSGESTEAITGDKEGTLTDKQHKSLGDLETNLLLDDDEPADQLCMSKYDVDDWSYFDDAGQECKNKYVFDNQSYNPDEAEQACIDKYSFDDWSYLDDLPRIVLPPNEDPYLGLTFGTCITDDTKQEAKSPSTFCSFDNALQDSGPACMGVDIGHKEAGGGKGTQICIQDDDDDDNDLDFDKEIASKGEDISEQEAIGYMCQDTFDRSPAHCWFGRVRDEYDVAEPDELDKINIRLAWHRIKAYELSKGSDIDDKKLKDHYTHDIFEKRKYFVDYEEEFDWFFHPEHIILSGLDDYQRLVPKLQKPSDFGRWKEYRLIFSDYACDKEYVEYCREISKKLKWVKPYIHLRAGSRKWTKLSNKAFIQALKIAAGYPHIFPNLVHQGYSEYMWRLRCDHALHDSLHGVCFEIWKLVAKEKKQFRDAFKEVDAGNLFPSSSDRLNRELSKEQDDDDSIEHQFNTYLVGIHEMAPENEVHEKIKEAIQNSALRIDGYDHYAERKIAIAKRIGLIDKVCSQS